MECVRDTEYPDILYLYHSHGAHSLSLRPIFDNLHLPQTTPGDQEAALHRSLQAEFTSEVAWLLQPATGEVSGRVAALAGLNDVYLGYALLLLTADWQLVTVELAFRSARISPNDGQGELVPGHQRLIEGPPSMGDGLQSTQHKAYVPFSDSSRFNLPPLLARRSNTPTTRFAVPQAAAGPRATRVSADGKIELTIESLRFVGQTVERLDMSIKDLVTAGNTVQERLELHLRELPRQVGKYQSLDDSLSQRDGDLTSFSKRLETVRTKQRELEKKADRVLQALIDNSQPELSTYELRWIEELDRVKHAVQESSARPGADRSLAARAERLREQLEMLKPQLDGHDAGNARADVKLGVTQRAKVEVGLAEEARLLAEARHRIERMQTKLNKTI